jgi:predicted PurR-regulated permease PerM
MISRQGIEQAIGVAVLALLAAGCFLVLRPFVPAILWAIVLSFSTLPLYTRLLGWLGGRRSLAAALMIIAVVCILVAPVAALAWSMADDIVDVAVTIQGWFQHGLPGPPAWVQTLPVVGARLSSRWQELAQAGAGFPAQLAPLFETAKTWSVIAATGVAGALLELVLSLLIAFFLYRDGPLAGELLTAVTERLTGERARRLIAVAGATIRGVVDGLIGANLIQAILAALGFWAAGVPGAFLLGFLVFFLTVIPFGAGLIWIPAVLWVMQVDTTKAMLLAAWCILVFPVLENVVRPYLVKRGISLPGLLVLLGMLGGLAAFGFLGVFLGPTLLALAYTLIEEWSAPDETAAASATPGDTANRRQARLD